MSNTTANAVQLRKDRVIAWAIHQLKSSGTCILDTETTDLDGEIIDLAILSANTGEVLYNSLIKPIGIISAAASRVHHLLLADLADAPTFLEAWPQVYSILSNYTNIVTYNAQFDLGRLRHTCLVNGLNVRFNMPAVPNFQYNLRAAWSCAMIRYASFYGEPGRYGSYNGDYKWQSLKFACQQMDIQHDNWHCALGDAEATLKLMRALAALHVAPKEKQEED